MFINRCLICGIRHKGSFKYYVIIYRVRGVQTKYYNFLKEGGPPKYYSITIGVEGCISAQRAVVSGLWDKICLSVPN